MQHFPSGYTIYDVYADGYVQTCYTLPCPECLEWTDMTTGLYAGLARQLLWLPAGQRSFVYPYAGA